VSCAKGSGAQETRSIEYSPCTRVSAGPITSTFVIRDKNTTLYDVHASVVSLETTGSSVAQRALKNGAGTASSPRFVSTALYGDEPSGRAVRTSRPRRRPRPCSLTLLNAPSSFALFRDGGFDPGFVERCVLHAFSAANKVTEHGVNRPVPALDNRRVMK
jgi:hypothetical protein